MLLQRLFVLLPAGLALAEPLLSRHVVHERRTALPPGWAAVGAAPADYVMNLRFGLAQSNMDRLEEFLMDVSHPDSPNYGQHWTEEKLSKTFAPSPVTIAAVRDWLASEGIHPSITRLTRGNSWLHLNLTVSEAEKLLATQYKVYEHESGVKKIGCDHYHLPEHISGKHVDIVTPSVHFDQKVDRRGVRTDLEKRVKVGKSIGEPGTGPVFPKTTETVQDILSELEDCDRYITPNCLRALYGIIYEPVATKKNSYGIVEYTPQAYLKEDLDLFYKNYSSDLVGKYPTLVSIDGGYAQTIAKSFSFNGESDLDIEYGQALVRHQNITLYQVGDIVEGASFNDFLDALDASYCAGDDPDQDGVYPDPYGTEDEGAYKGPKDCGDKPISYVISTSYAYNEADLTPAYTKRQCNEYARLALLGITFLYSSGDYGVAGNGGYCLTADGEQSTSGTVFNPSFPGTCPYITSIGATQLPAGKNVTDPESATYEVIYSGGGFSNYFARPSYQEEAVASYFANHNPPYSADTYNRTGRGLPDISANGANYVVAVDGDFYLVFGTSASSPVVGAMLSNVNDARLALGKSPIGFINPALYSSKFKSVWNDITNGTNPGCGTEGFSAVTGWDPVTGLGTPKFPLLLAKFLTL